MRFPRFYSLSGAIGPLNFSFEKSGGPKLGASEPLSKSMGAWKASECEKTIGFPCIFDIPKMGILEVDKPKPVSELAQDGQDKNFTKTR